MYNEIRRNLLHRMKNTSYIFVPFFCHNQFNQLRIVDYWREKNQGNKYFMKYIIDKIKHDSVNVCCRPYLMDDGVRDKLGIVKSSRQCFLQTRQYTSGDQPFSFCIGEILLFLFETNIGFLIFKIEHPKGDSYKQIASKNYHLKKIHTTLLYAEKDDGTKDTLVLGSENIKSLSSLSEYILAKTVNQNVEIFFNYSTKEERRSNVLSHYHLALDKCLSENNKEQIENILFLLKRNYHQEWEPELDSVYKESEYYKASPYIHWGISSEATICLTISDPETFFVGNSFYDNFHSYYLYEYILALHQKYALYYFLTSFRAESELEELERNVAELADFRAKYVFQIISESETYQTVYRRHCEVFELKTLFGDIDEQVNRVVQLKTGMSERKLEKQDESINLILGLLAFFGIFSASNDIVALFDSLDWLLKEHWIPYIQRFSCVALWLFSFTLLIFFIRANWKKIRKTKKEGKKRGKKCLLRLKELMDREKQR